MKHANVSVFVPHAGCPHQCSFCDQRAISGAQAAPDGAAVAALCARAEGELAQKGRTAQIAFFGGSFTAVPRAYMIELLEAARPFLGRGVFTGVRISTRPDCIDDETLDTLARYGVTAVELGVQSMDDTVLSKNGRGHTAADTNRASALVRAHGLELGLQMMTGLYGANGASDLMSARLIAALMPATVRVYPTLVLEGTRLAALWRAGLYRPQTHQEAAALGARLLDFFEARGVRVIRMGLHAQPSLAGHLLAGPYHPAFRELCEGALMYGRAKRLLNGRPPGRYRLHVAPKSVSKLCGHGARPTERLRAEGYDIKIRPNADVRGLDVKVEDV